VENLMLVRIAAGYARLLFAITALLFGLTLAYHIGILVRAEIPYAEVGRPLIFLNFLACPAMVAMSKERNIWKNEFKSCPAWMRKAVAGFCIYGIVGMVASLVANDAVPSYAMPASAFFIGFDAIGVCVLYSVVWADPLESTELKKRARNSVIFTTLWVLLFTYFRHDDPKHPQTRSQAADFSN
jgi:hypothetical protein